MATSALVNVQNENNELLMSIHVQHDGGERLKTNLDRIIKEGRYINYLSFSNPVLGEAFLGMGCFAASLIAKLKTECGDVFITKNTNANNMYDFVYNIHFDEENKKIVMY